MNKKELIFSLAQLKEYLFEKEWDLERIKLPSESLTKETFFLLIPKYYLDLINWYDEKDPLRHMVINNHLERDIRTYEVSDPIGDEPHSPVAGIVHRYPDRCLLMLTNICAVHCRFCFRKNILQSNSAHLEKSIDYIKTHEEIWEVIFSGGDPFMLTDYFLKHVLEKLDAIKHVKVIRFHTRTPAVFPNRITSNFISTLTIEKPLCIVIHINHPKEITREFITAIQELKSTGALLLSQTVLMKNVNNNALVLSKLFKNLVEIGIKPYYLHHLDPAEGTHYFRVSVEEGKKIMRQLRGHISGVCIPEYVIDVPGGYGKIPVFWFKQVNSKKYQATTFENKKVMYTDYSGINES